MARVCQTTHLQCICMCAGRGGGGGVGGGGGGGESLARQLLCHFLAQSTGLMCTPYVYCAPRPDSGCSAPCGHACTAHTRGAAYHTAQTCCDCQQRAAVAHSLPAESGTPGQASQGTPAPALHEGWGVRVGGVWGWWACLMANSVERQQPKKRLQNQEIMMFSDMHSAPHCACRHTVHHTPTTMLLVLMWG